MDLSGIGATGIIALVLLAFAAIGFIKGLIRTVSSMICLALSGYAALWANQNTHELSGSLISETNTWLPKVAAAVAGLTVFFIGRYILKFIANPFEKSEKNKEKEKGFNFGLPSALICLLISLAIFWIGSNIINHSGNLSEIRQTQSLILSGKDKKTVLAAEPLLLKAKHFISSSLLGKLQRKTDPFHTPGNLSLCQLLIMNTDTDTRVEMLKHSEIHDVLNNPLFINLAFDEELKDVIQSGDSKEILKHPKVLQAIEDETLKNSITALPESLLSSILKSTE